MSVFMSASGAEIHMVADIAPGSDFSDYIKSLNPIAYYRLGETGSDTIAIDEISGYNGTYHFFPDLDAPSLVASDPANTSADFSGGAWASIYPLLAPLQATSTGTVSFIYKAEQSHPAMISTTNSVNNDLFILFYTTNIEAVFHFQSSTTVGTNNYTIKTTSFSPVFGEIYHVDYVQDAAEGVLIYVNGVLQTTTRNTTPDDRWFDDVGTDRLSISYVDRPSAIEYAGKLDEIIFWGRRLTAQEILNKYNIATYIESNQLAKIHMVAGAV